MAKPYFNSTMVRLKVVGCSPFHPLIQNFNSTMVRLKADLLGLLEIVKTIFQFHYGSVKR